MLDPEEIERAVARQTIEVAPLAYMRGRTLSNAFVILDEAQNTTTEQMFMLLTRIGPNSKCVVTGDVTQIDLPSNKRSGLVEALQALKRCQNRDRLFQRTRCGPARTRARHHQRLSAASFARGGRRAKIDVPLPQTQCADQARSRFAQDAPPPQFERLPTFPRIRALREVDCLHRLRHRAGHSDFSMDSSRSRQKRSSSRCSSCGRGDSALDQSAKDIRANVAAATRFRTVLVQLAATKLVLILCHSRTFASLRPETAALIAPYALAPMVLSVLLGRNHGLYAAIFVSLWTRLLFEKLRCAAFGVRLDQRIHRGLSHSPSSPAEPFDSGRLRRRPGHLAFVAHFRHHRSDRSLRPTRQRLAIARPAKRARHRQRHRHRHHRGRHVTALEHLFRITTDISWLEASDLNHPLLRRMTIEAPGTYHHSLVVANLAEAAAEAIGANATLCRVCSYFHDIGKVGEAGLFHREHELRAQPARRSRADHERPDHHRARQRRRGPRAQTQPATARSSTSSSSITARRWSIISTSARCSNRKTRAPAARS